MLYTNPTMATTTTTQTSASSQSFKEELQRLDTLYQSNPEAATLAHVNKAIETAVAAFCKTPLLYNAAVCAASTGWKSCRLTTWTLDTVPRFMNIPLGVLCDEKGLITAMQTSLDADFGKGSFRVYNHRVSRTHGPLEFALSLSWDDKGFDQVDQILAGNQRAALLRKEARDAATAERLSGEGDAEGETQQHRSSSGRGEGRGGYQGRGRGGQGYQGGSRGRSGQGYQGRGAHSSHSDSQSQSQGTSAEADSQSQTQRAPQRVTVRTRAPGPSRD